MGNSEQADAISQTAIEGELQKLAGKLIDDAAYTISQYINTVAGQRVIGEPDNTIRATLAGLLLDYKEKLKDSAKRQTEKERESTDES
jgi:hypothetical protein